MRLITLNTWGGKLYEPLCQFLKKYKDTTDIFCFQEVFDKSSHARPIMKGARLNLYEDISLLLPDFKGHIAIPQNNDQGTALFVRRNYSLAAYGAPFIYRSKDALVEDDSFTLPKQLQYGSLRQTPVTIFNLHGLWSPIGKGDIPERLKQSENIRNIVNAISGYKIICGDFNLLPNTQSLALVEQNMRNLIKEYKISSTRTTHYKKKDKFADYILISPEICVHDFSVLPEECSDHAALLLDFDAPSL